MQIHYHSLLTYQKLMFRDKVLDIVCCNKKRFIFVMQLHRLTELGKVITHHQMKTSCVRSKVTINQIMSKDRDQPLAC